MATYYIRKTGSDANAGTSAGAAWLTIGKALGASGIASGDTVYIGAGVYREVVTVNMTSATVETFVVGDVDGKYTGDAGEVQWSGYTTNDKVFPPSSRVLTLNGKDFLTFKNIVFVAAAGICVYADTQSSVDIKFMYCLFVLHPNGANAMSVTSDANAALNWVVDSCTFLKQANGIPIVLTLARPASADFDYNFQIKNCVFIGGGGYSISVTTTGVNAF